jgi:hypothetical protein
MIVVVLALLVPAAAGAEQPMDRFEKMITTGKGADVVKAAQRWLERNVVDDRRDAVRVLLHEAAYAVVLARPSVGAAKEYQERYPRSRRLEDARFLEANMSLYAAGEVGTEAAYLDVAEGYAGTPAGREARSRAEDAAFSMAEEAATVAAWGRFLGDYRGGAKFEEARDRFQDHLWREAEEANTVESWLDLRSSDPEHPRVVEALDREATLALTAVGSEPIFKELNKVARRYSAAPAGIEAYRRAGAFARVLLFDEAGTAPPDTVPVADLGVGVGDEIPEVATVGELRAVWPGRLPRGASLVAELLHHSHDGEGRPWSEVAVERVAAWSGTTPADEDAIGLPCVVDPARESFEVRLTLLSADGEGVKDYSLPLTVTRRCRGPRPYAIAKAEDGTLAAWSLLGEDGTWSDPRAVPAVGGFAWPCEAVLVSGLDGVWARCSGREIALDQLPLRAIIRPPRPGAQLVALVPLVPADPSPPPAVPSEGDEGLREPAPEAEEPAPEAEEPAPEAEEPAPEAEEPGSDSALEIAPLPEPPKGAAWYSPALAAADLLGAPPACPLPIVPPEPTTEDASPDPSDDLDPSKEPTEPDPSAVAEPPAQDPEATPTEPPTEPPIGPPRPDWLPATLEPLAEEIVDLDGDRRPDRVLVVEGAGQGPRWILVVPGSRPHITWAEALPEDVDPAAGVPPLTHDGCSFRVVAAQPSPASAP